MKGFTAKRFTRRGMGPKRIGKTRIPKRIPGIKRQIVTGPTPGPGSDTGEKA